MNTGEKILGVDATRTSKWSGRKQLRASIVVLLFALVSVGVLIVTNGNVAAAFGFVALVGVLAVTVYSLEYGLYIFLGTVLVLDQFPVPTFDSYTSRLFYFTNLNASPVMPPNGIVVSLMELHLFLLIVVWLVRTGLRREITTEAVPVWAAAVMFFVAVIGAFGYGQVHGGDLTASTWEVRPFFYLGIMFVLTPQIIRTREQLRTSLWVCIAAIAVKAFQGVSRFAMQGFSFGDIRTLTNHDDPAFFVTLFMLLIGLTVFNSREGQRRGLFLLLPLLIGGFFTGLRRATYVSLAVCVIAYLALLPGRLRNIGLRYVAALAFVFVCYVAAFWNSGSSVGIIAQQVKVAILNDPAAAVGGTTVAEDYSSNLYRKWEDYNLAFTFKKSPLIGIGFGVPYDMPLLWWGLSEVSYLIYYIPHNQILWLAVKMGAVGFFCFLFFLNAYVFKGAAAYWKLKDPYLKSICAMCVLAVINQIVVAAFDMQLTWYRSMIYLGFVMGLLPLLVALDAQNETLA